MNIKNYTSLSEDPIKKWLAEDAEAGKALGWFAERGITLMLYRFEKHIAVRAIGDGQETKGHSFTGDYREALRAAALKWQEPTP